MGREQSPRHALNEIAKATATTSDGAAVRARAMAETDTGPKRKVSEDGRRLLREACIAMGMPSDMGNRLADWFDAHDNAKVSIEGQSDLPPLRVFSEPDVAPAIPESVPFQPGVQADPNVKPEVWNEEGRVEGKR